MPLWLHRRQHPLLCCILRRRERGLHRYRRRLDVPPEVGVEELPLREVVVHAGEYSEELGVGRMAYSRGRSCLHSNDSRPVLLPYGIPNMAPCARSGQAGRQALAGILRYRPQSSSIVCNIDTSRASPKVRLRARGSWEKRDGSRECASIFRHGSRSATQKQAVR